jgi:hypothetical protein
VLRQLDIRLFWGEFEPDDRDRFVSWAGDVGRLVSSPSAPPEAFAAVADRVFGAYLAAWVDDDGAIRLTTPECAATTRLPRDVVVEVIAHLDRQLR